MGSFILFGDEEAKYMLSVRACSGCLIPFIIDNWNNSRFLVVMRKILIKISCLFVIAIFFASVFHISVFAQNADSVARRQAELQAELDATNKEIERWAKVLKDKQSESASIERDIAVLDAKIAEAKAIIRSKNIIIEQLGKDINEKSETIDLLDDKLSRQRDSLAGLIRRANEIESYTTIELVLSDKTLTEFFSDLDSFDSVQAALKQAFVDVRDTKQETQTEKNTLSKKKNAETDAREIIVIQQKQIQKNEAEKRQLLAASKSQEKSYQEILNERQKKAAQIRAALFSLRDTAAIPFGDAYKYALQVQKVTGVRPAFLLAILTQETNLGENTGQCLVTNLETGDGVGKNTGRIFTGVMKSPRDTVPFKGLASRLGFDPTTKAVSCPQAGGYGGAMGPSQFIPSTWVGYEKRIASASGVSIPDPWIPRDAFFASALYLSDLGASGGTYTSEHQAAAKYYAGSSWKTRGTSYANSVMGHAARIQETMIDPLQNL